MELNRQLALAFTKYNGKNNLIVVVKDRSKGSALADLEEQQGVKSLAFDQLFPLSSATALAASSAGVLGGSAHTGQAEDYSPTEK